MGTVHDLLDRVRDLLDAGIWHTTPQPVAATAFLLVCALGVALFVPKTLFAPAAGALFGVTVGTVVTLAGATLGGLLALGVGRRLGRQRVRAWLLRRSALERLDRELSRDGLLPVTVLRMVPVLPASVVNYGAAATDVRTSHFAAGTALGMLPVTLVQVAAGASLRHGVSTGVVVAASAGCVTVAAALWWARRRLARDTPPTPRPGTADEASTRVVDAASTPVVRAGTAPADTPETSPGPGSLTLPATRTTTVTTTLTEAAVTSPTTQGTATPGTDPE